MNIQEIKQGLKNGNYVLSGGRVYTRDEWAQLEEARLQYEHYDLLQLTKKIQL